MNNTIDTGGPAFPTAYKAHDGVGGFTTEYVNGMELRDYFAARAMLQYARPAGIKHWFRWLVGMNYQVGTPDPFTAAVKAYQMADAMIMVRKLNPGKKETEEAIMNLHKKSLE